MGANSVTPRIRGTVEEAESSLQSLTSRQQRQQQHGAMMESDFDESMDGSSSDSDARNAEDLISVFQVLIRK